MLAWLGALLVRALSWTLRVRIEGPEPPADRPLLYAFHHGRQFGLFRYPRPRRVAVLSSLSRDGRLQAGILTRLGFAVVAGSSSRGGARGLVGLVRRIRAGLDAAFAVDGPRGPSGQVKPGIVALARHTGALIVPITFFADRAKRFDRAWDRYLLPRPFARTLILRGQMIEVPRDGDESSLETARVALERSLEHLDLQAEESFARDVP